MDLLRTRLHLGKKSHQTQKWGEGLGRIRVWNGGNGQALTTKVWQGGIGHTNWFRSTKKERICMLIKGQKTKGARMGAAEPGLEWGRKTKAGIRQNVVGPECPRH